MSTAPAPADGLVTPEMVEAFERAANQVARPSQVAVGLAAVAPMIAGASAPEWQPIETAPLDKHVLLWWRPIGDANLYAAETCVIGQVSPSGIWWNGQRQEDQDLWHVTHWLPLPSSPREQGQ